ncbi:ATP-binding protein [Streptomyces sp. FIT100]|uniref:ATP-binding protein n=1 Tax=Streptomyces sp. FIT100 TaxID=2837956 RepID=UPI0021CAC17A|nr:ATP-binding protein [Streptomyces sp. FIT100]UUN29227.1 ATP-binding protein [Streptomyces sp. FIT100]
MDPINRGPEEYGHDIDRFDEGDDTAAGVSRPPRDALPELGQKAAAPARTVRLVSGDFLLTVNPVDGSEIEPCPPGERPSPPARHTAEQREELRRAAQPPAPAGPAAPPLPLLEREEERERLLRLLGRGRSVRLTGPAGSGRTTLLDIVAADCAGLAPDGVVRLSGHHRTPTELLYELLAAVHRVPQHRPDRAGLLELVRGIGAVVLVDDLEFGGSALDELLGATPECAFLLAATPDVVAPSPDSHLEEVFLQGLGRSATLELLERAVERPLTDEESNWAGDLWFESEGLPLRFVQAGALLRQRDALRIPDPDPVDEDDENVFADGHDAPLPTLGEGAAPAALLASRLSESAREALRFAVALGGEMPHQAHLPALVGDTHADAALGELTSCGLLTPVGSRYRLASGVATQLEAEGYGEDAVARARTAAQHYAWWTGHPSVAAERAAAEADAVLAAMTALVPGSEAGHPSAAVLLARSAAPAFAAGLHWGAWERVLRTGQEAARIAGEVAEEAYFHHELGVLALCAGNLDRARAELEASIALRGALADKGGTVAGRRALALVTDRESTAVAAEAVPVASTPPAGVPAAVAPPTEPLVTRQDTPPPAALLDRLRRTVLTGTRRNVAAAGAGALLVAVLGTVVTLGATAGNDEPADQVTNEQSATENDGDSGDGLTAEQPSESPTRSPSPTKSAPDDPSAPASAEPGESGSAGDPSTPGGAPSTTGGIGSSSSSSTTGSPSTTGGTTGSSTTGGPTGGTGSGGPTGGTDTGGTDTGGTDTGGTTSDPTGGTDTGGTDAGGTDTGGTTGNPTGGSDAGGTTGDPTGGSDAGGTEAGGTTSGSVSPSSS